MRFSTYFGLFNKKYNMLKNWKKKKRHIGSLHLHLHGNSSLQQHIVHTINNLCNKLLFIESIFCHIQLESIDMLYLWLVRTWRRDSEQCLKLPHEYCEIITIIVAFQCPWQKKGVQLGVCNVVVVVVGGGGQLCCFYLFRKHTCFVIECECNSSCKVRQGNSQDCNQLCDIHWCVNWAYNSPVHLEHSKQKLNFH